MAPTILPRRGRCCHRPYAAVSGGAARRGRARFFAHSGGRDAGSAAAGGCVYRRCARGGGHARRGGGLTPEVASREGLGGLINHRPGHDREHDHAGDERRGVNDHGGPRVPRGPLIGGLPAPGVLGDGTVFRHRHRNGASPVLGPVSPAARRGRGAHLRGVHRASAGPGAWWSRSIRTRPSSS